MRRDGDRILVGLAADAAATAVLAVAQRLAAAVGAEVDVLHVGSSIPERVADVAAAVGAVVTLEPGTPVDVLTRRLADTAVVAAVVGCRAEDDPHTAGHVSLGLLRHASVPVVVVPPQTTVGQDPLHDVLLPLDGTSETAMAVDPAVAALAGSGLQVTVAHVFDATRVPRFLDQPHHALGAWGREFLARHTDRDVDLVLRAGRPGEQLLEVVQDTMPDLVVLGWSQDLSPGRATTIRHLLSASPVPLLLVPTDGQDPPVRLPQRVGSGGSDW